MNGATKASALWASTMTCLLVLFAAMAAGCSDANNGNGSGADAASDASAGATTPDAARDAPADSTTDATLCQSTMTDPANCGSCGHACLADQVCSSGACGMTCSAELLQCTVDSGRALCIITQTDNANCGACGNACGPGMVCSAGKCGLTCQAGMVNCGGSCVDPGTSRAFCGASGTCQGANAGAACAAGQVCSMGTCGVSCPGNEVNCNETCVDPRTSNRFCGATGACQGATAGAVCAAGQVCSGGVCGLTCQSGLVACDGKCVDPAIDRLFCGASGDCKGANAGTACAAGRVCSGGACGLTCQAGLVACNGSCVDPITSGQFCGASGTCQDATAGTLCPSGQVCSGGACALSCPTGQINCNGSCFDPMTSNQFCGARADCAGPNVGTACQSGTVCAGGSCRLSCQAGLVICNGTCVNTSVSNQHCGACGAACRAGNVCNGGVCGVSCQLGLLNCGGTCFDPTTSRAHCGATLDCAGPNAGAVCDAGQVCKAGACVVSCPNPQVNCGGSCVNGLTDPNHCGATGDCSSSAGNSPGVACPGGATCQAGGCGCPSGETVSHDAVAGDICCPTGQINCSGICVDVGHDPNNCGGCGSACPTRAHSASVCSGGCSFVCSAGFKDCNGDPADGCESTSASDTHNCGTCGNACTSPANSSPVCTGGSCTGFTCTPPFLDCDGVAANGCETDSSTDTAHCGTCGTSCTPPANSGPTCAGGTCGSACLTGFGDCDMTLADGCEAALNTNANCGACGTACTGATACCGSSCLPTSAPPAVCTTGTDPITSSPWVVCAADATTAWISANNAGNYHAQAICQSLGYCRADAWGGTFGRVCGNSFFMASSCSATGNRAFGSGDPGSSVIGFTVMWECVH